MAGAILRNGGQEGTLLRRYQSTIGSYGAPEYVWGGGTYTLLATFSMAPLNMSEGLVTAGRYKFPDCKAYFPNSPVIAKDDRVKAVQGTFDVDYVRPIISHMKTIGFEAYLKAIAT